MPTLPTTPLFPPRNVLAIQSTVAFGHVGLHRVFGRADGRNDASAGLMRRLGMQQEAHLRHNEIFKGEWGDELIYAIREEQWRAR